MSHLRTLTFVSLAAACLMVGVGMIVALLPRRVLEFAGSLQDVGAIASLFALTYLLVQVPLGRLADRVGAKPLLLFGYLLCALSGLVFHGADSTNGIFLGRLIQGAGEAPIWALGPALLALAYPQAKGRAIGLYNAAIHGGLAAGPLLGVLLFPASGDNGPFLWFAALSLCGGLAIALALPGRTKTARKLGVPGPTLRQLAGAVTSPASRLILPAVLLYGAGYGTFVSVLPAVLAMAKGFDERAAGLFFTLFYLAIGLTQLLVGPWSDRWGRRRFMVGGLVLAAIGFASFFAFDLPWIYGPLVMASAGLGVFCVASLSYLTETVADRIKATVSGLYYLVWGLGYLAGPLMIGWLGETERPQMGFWGLAALLMVQAVVLLSLPAPTGGSGSRPD